MNVNLTEKEIDVIRHALSTHIAKWEGPPTANDLRIAIDLFNSLKEPQNMRTFQKRHA